MRILAFLFTRESAARDALTALQTDTAVPDERIDLAPLVVDGEEGTIVALSVNDTDIGGVVQRAVSLGGRLVADVPEEWTRVSFG